MARIFISYRREDSHFLVSRLVDELRKHFPPEQVFQDIASIDPGADFVEALEKALSTAAVMLAVIGQGWLSATDKQGRRRLDLPGDFVRQEIAETLRRPGVRVFPLLVNGAEMPAAEELPEPLKALHRRQAFELTARHWPEDVAQLVQTLKRRDGFVRWLLHDSGFSFARLRWAKQAAQRREAEERAAKEEAERIAAEDRAKKKAEPLTAQTVEGPPEQADQQSQVEALAAKTDATPQPGKVLRATTTSTPTSHNLFRALLVALIIAGLIAFVAMRASDEERLTDEDRQSRYFRKQVALCVENVCASAKDGDKCLALCKHAVR